MEYMYAALLLHKAKQPINEANMRKVLTAAGAHSDEGKIKAVVAALEGANIEDIIAKASAVAAAPVAAPAHGAAPAEAKPHKSEEDEKKKEEEAAAGLGALFG